MPADGAGLMSVDEATFAEHVLQSERPVLVDFYGTNCSSCKLLAPVLADLAATQSRLGVVALNVDENPRVARTYGVRGVPVMKVYVGGEVVKTIVGAKPRSVLTAELAEHLA